MRLSAAVRREQLLDVTKGLVGDRGFHGVSLEAIARAAGVTRPIVYAHFGDLTAVFQALIDRELARALDQLEAVLPGRLQADAAAQLLAALGAYLDAVAAEPVTWRLVLLPPEGAPPILRDRIAAGRAVVVSRLAAVVGSDVASEWTSPDPELTARALSAFADEAARLVLTDPAAYSRERILAHAGWALGRVMPKMG